MDVLAATSAAIGGFLLGLLIATVLRRHRRLDVRFEFHAERAIGGRAVERASEERRRREDEDTPP